MAMKLIRIGTWFEYWIVTLKVSYPTINGTSTYEHQERVRIWRKADMDREEARNRAKWQALKQAERKISLAGAAFSVELR
jgi:hypothetical protein